MEKASHNQHQENNVAPTMGSGELLIALYDGAIRHIGNAKEQIQAGEVNEKQESLNKAGAIIVEFIKSLVHDRSNDRSEQQDGC